MRLSSGGSRVLWAALAVAGVALAAALTAPREGSAAPAAAPAAAVDPRAGGLEVALGEWSVGLEAKAVRPGLVTFAIVNRGKLVHGFEIARLRNGEDDEGELETEDLRPGASTRMTVRLEPGVYRIECSVGDHDERGMVTTLTVRDDAPLAAPAAAKGNRVTIRNFAYAPAVLRVEAGTTVRWRNDDSAPHTITGTAFSSKVLGRNGAYARQFTRRGTYTYMCALHPQMKARVIVR